MTVPAPAPLSAGGGGGPTYTDAAPIITRPTDAGPAFATTYNRFVLADSPVTVAAGALRVLYVVLADGVTVEGKAVPVGVSVVHGSDGFLTPALDFVIDATGDVLVIEDRPV